MHTTSPLNRSWLVAAFSVCGALALCGVGGGMIASALGIWPLPVAGFSAAFAVVSLTYLSAPRFKLQVSISAFIAGCIFAWFLLEVIYIPGTLNNIPAWLEHLPIISTVAGGLAALFICITLTLRKSGT